ncbi:MAG: bifunctional serine/threonine-protein kinase/formylglycine-generating enzyme family protein [Polyangia bacterium]
MLSEGQILGSYRIIRKIGEGGMGAVYEAVHQEIGRRAAIKVLHSQFAQNPQIAARFMNEAKAANIIDHPGCVEIYEFLRLPDGTTCIVMELLKGEHIGKRLQRGPLGLDTLRIVRQVASVLAEAHAHGIVHRDLKPDNVFMVKDPEAPGGERAKVLDFGIAKIAEESTLKTQAGSILGTPVYMAPEQCRGAANVTAKSDVYALGVMMYEMLAGHPPFNGEGIGDIMIAHISKEPPPLREAQPAVSADLAALVHRMLDKDPAKRPTMVEVIQATEALGAARTGVMSAVHDSAVLTPPVSPPTAAPDSKTIAGEPTAPAATRPQTLPIGDTPVRKTAVLPDEPKAAGATDSRKIILGAAIGVGALVAIGVTIALVRPGKPKPTPPDMAQGKVVKPPKKPEPPPERPEPPVPPPEGMAYVPGERFEMGSSEAEVDAAFKLCQQKGVACRRDLYEREMPRRPVRISDLFLDKTEVTNTQLVEWLNKEKGLKVDKKRFVRAGKQLLVDLAVGVSGVDYVGGKGEPYKVHEGFGSRPAVLVTWLAAQRFCAAQGKRLPTEAEWELAARGPERRLFPWGEKHPRCGDVVFGRGAELPNGRNCKNLDSTPDSVGRSKQDVTPDGIFDLGGNVLEWVQDRFEERYASCDGECKDPVVDEAADGGAAKGKGAKKSKKPEAVLRVVRGGSYNFPADACRGAGRSRQPQDVAQGNVGFRCAKTVTQ